MMIEPPIEELAKKAGNKYLLCNLVSKRAKEIQKKNQEEEILDPEIKEITMAALELEDDEIGVEIIEDTKKD